MEINILIDKRAKGELEPSWLQSIVQQVFEAQGAGAEVEFGLVITTEEKVRQLNRNYRGRDEPTDVLAFSTREEVKADLPPFVQPPDGILHLGEVIISYPQAVVQAEEHGHPVKKEIAILVIHGVLHLLGYEHDKPKLARQMRTKEAELLGYIENALLEE